MSGDFLKIIETILIGIRLKGIGSGIKFSECIQTVPILIQA